jgi:hypothetical protein
MTDVGNRVPDPPAFEFVMPAVKDIRVQAVKSEIRRPRNLTTAVPGGVDTFAFVVVTEQPIPIRALGPVLYVGDAVVPEVTEIGPNTYRFVAHAPAELRRGAPIRLGWTGHPPADQQSSTFRFDP